MFVVHILKDGKETRTRDFGHVNQFYKMYPVFRNAKGEPVFEECIEQGFIYIHIVNRPDIFKNFYTYQKNLALLLTEVAYNRDKSN